jgi:ABC-type bacteriocin/lantibiotic exporter with double-glycine peptidase domain
MLEKNNRLNAKRSTWFWQSYSKVRWYAVLSMLVLIVYMLTNFIIIGVQKWIIDDVFFSQQYDNLPFMLFIFAAGFMAFAILNPVNAMIRDFVYNKFLINVSKRYINHVGRLPLYIFQKERTAQYVYHFSHDIRSFSQAVTKEIPTAVQQAVYIILLMAVIGWISPVILGCVLFFSLMYIVLGRYFSPKIKKSNKKVQDRKSKLLVHIEEGISSTREVVAYHRQQWEKAIYDRLFGSYFKSVIAEGKLENQHLFLSEPMRWGANISILGYGGYLVITGQLSIGWLVVVYQFGSQLMEAMQLLFQLLMKISGKMANFERLDRLFQEKIIDDGSVDMLEPISQITFHNLSFEYDQSQKPILNNVDLTMRKKQKIAFVGTSGGGKSTLLQILSKDNTPSEGLVLINGTIPLNDIAHSSWSSRVQVVFQEPYLFQESIEINVRIGCDNVDFEDVVNACRLAQIHDYIETLPEGYQTIIGERGITLSGGQRQRLALARSVLNQPDVLLLDEATSALDMETERKVQQSLDETMVNGIMIVVAHRLSTIENADVIYVLDQGSIVESGNHHQLIANQGVYAKLYDQQREFK